MPLPMLRNGNVYPERASFSKTHGATPTQCKIMFENLCNIALGSDYNIQISGSLWSGIVVDVHEHKSESVGLVTEITCNDVRELLMSQTVFCQINQIDRKTGKLFCIFDDTFVDALVYLGYIDQSEANGEYGKWDFLREFSTWDYIYPMTLINVLCHLVDYDPPQYSNEAREILNAAATQIQGGVKGSLLAINNIFGIDWHLGEKVGVALTQIANLLGLQFTLVPGLDLSGRSIKCLHFYRIGEPSYTDIHWSGDYYAQETTKGNALQTNVDTGVYITGERDVWEMQNADLIPAWNQKWNRWAIRGKRWVAKNILKPAGFDLLSTTIADLAYKAKVVDVCYSYTKVDGTVDFTEDPYSLNTADLYDFGFTNSGYFEDLTINDYLERVVFKVYRIAFMQWFLSEDEFWGRNIIDYSKVPVRFKPIHTPLLSDPSVPYHCNSTIVLKKSKRHAMDISNPKMRREKGHRLSEETGHISFDTMQFTQSDAAWTYSDENQGNPPPPDGDVEDDTYFHSSVTNIIPDAPSIDVCFYGPVFREPYGTTEPFTENGALIFPRVGTKKIQGLRRGKIVTDASMTDPFDIWTTPWALEDKTVKDYMAAIPEAVLNPNYEFKAEQEAQLIAAAWLNRPHIVSSGEEYFAGFAGHEPDGEIRRVNVTMDGIKGIYETVAYANDFPSVFHEPDIELSRQMGVDSALRQADRLKYQQLIMDQKQQSEAELTDEMKDDGLLTHHSTRVVVGNPLEVGMAEQIHILRGECIPVVTDWAGGEFKTIPEASIDSTYKGAHGIALEDMGHLPKNDSEGFYGRMNIITSGQAPALVMGPCSAGDTLALAADAADKANWPTMGKYLKKSSSGTIVAMEDVAAPEDEDDPPVMRWVKIGGGGGEASIDAVVRLTSTTNIPRVSNTATTITFASQPIIDSVTPSVDDLVLLKNQTSSGGSSVCNGIWKVGAYQTGIGYVWTRDGTLTSGMKISVRNGTRNTGSIWVLTTAAPITPGTTALSFGNRTWNDYVNAVAAGTSKSTSMDGITITAGQVVLVVSGTDVGAWQYVSGTDWLYLDKPLSCGVQQGPTYGQATWFLNSGGTAYVVAKAAYAS